METNLTMPVVDAPEKKERGEAIDFKMVTFSLAGKDYGIDIMNVKEIAKASKFTYVPNAAGYLRGVYNLRGDIIPVIDLRVFFHLPAERKSEDSLESMLILRVGEQVFGVIVDNIDKVVGISSSVIQPPHPIFGDINIKYIRGVVENLGNLYIILDIDRIFAVKAETKKRVIMDSGADTVQLEVVERESPKEEIRGGETDKDFINETLAAFQNFHVSAINYSWAENRFEQWKKERKGQTLQIRDAETAADYLKDFYSPYTSELWSQDYANAVYAALPDVPSKTIQVWNPGCGKGHETFSFAVVLRKRYPNARIKIWANDGDLLSISTAPNMVFEFESVSEFYRDFMVKGRNGYAFNQLIKDSIMFEYHDILNINPFSELDFILARDLLSFLKPDDQTAVFGDFVEKLKSYGVVFLGRNERPPNEADWKALAADPVSAYIRAE